MPIPKPSDIFPEYDLLRGDKFDTLAKAALDEWIDYLKTGDIPVTATKFIPLPPNAIYILKVLDNMANEAMEMRKYAVKWFVK